MSDANNIIAFPVERVVRDRGGYDEPVVTEEDVQERAEAVRHLHIDNIIGPITETLMHQLIVGGFVVDEDDSKDIAFIVEAVRSLMCRRYNIFHPFQKFAEEAMTDTDGDEVYIVRDGIDIICNDEEEDVEIDDEGTIQLIEYHSENEIENATRDISTKSSIEDVVS